MAKYEKGDNIFGQRLRAFRIETGLSQAGFAEKLGIAQPTYSVYETGRANPSIEIAVRIAEKFDVSIDWLCGKEREEVSTTKTFGDIANWLFQILESKGFEPDITIQDRMKEDSTGVSDDNVKNWVRMTLYDHPYGIEGSRNDEFANLFRNVINLHRALMEYDISLDYYEFQKEQMIARFCEIPVTKAELPNLSDEERFEKRLKFMDAAYKRLYGKQD